MEERESSVDGEVDNKEVPVEATDEYRQRQRDCRRSSSESAHGIVLAPSSGEKYLKGSSMTLM